MNTTRRVSGYCASSSVLYERGKTTNNARSSSTSLRRCCWPITGPLASNHSSSQAQSEQCRTVISGSMAYVERLPRLRRTRASPRQLRTQTGWTTHGHSGVDVNIYSSASDTARRLVGNYESLEVHTCTHLKEMRRHAVLLCGAAAA